MGLDAGFRFCYTDKETKKDTFINIVYFRKYQPLSDYIYRDIEYAKDISNKGKDEDGEEGLRGVLFEISEKCISKLENELKDFIPYLVQAGTKKIIYYDEVGYPNNFFPEEIAFDSKFCPSTSPSSFAGQKLLKLWYAVQVMLDWYADNSYDTDFREGRLSIQFWQSF